MSDLYCPECGNPIRGTAPFCSYCGHHLSKLKENKTDKRICAVCGTQIKEEELFCSNCGARWAEKAEEPKKEQKTSKIGTVTASSKKFIIIAAVAVVIAVISAIVAINQYSVANSEKITAEYARRAYSSMNEKLVQIYSLLGVDLGQVGEDERFDEAQKKLQELNSQIDGMKKIQEDYEEKLALYSDLDELYGYGSENFYADKGVIVLGMMGKSSEELGIYANIQGSTYYMKADSGGIEYEWSHEWDNNKTHVIVTAKSTGYYTITFTNDQNNDSFDVLVIVVSSWDKTDYLDDVLNRIEKIREGHGY